MGQVLILKKVWVFFSFCFVVVVVVVFPPQSLVLKLPVS